MDKLKNKRDENNIDKQFLVRLMTFCGKKRMEWRKDEKLARGEKHPNEIFLNHLKILSQAPIYAPAKVKKAIKVVSSYFHVDAVRSKYNISDEQISNDDILIMGALPEQVYDQDTQFYDQETLYMFSAIYEALALYKALLDNPLSESLAAENLILGQAEKLTLQKAGVSALQAIAETKKTEAERALQTAIATTSSGNNTRAAAAEQAAQDAQKKAKTAEKILQDEIRASSKPQVYTFPANLSPAAMIALSNNGAKIIERLPNNTGIKIELASSLLAKDLRDKTGMHRIAVKKSQLTAQQYNYFKEKLAQVTVEADGTRWVFTFARALFPKIERVIRDFKAVLKDEAAAEAKSFAEEQAKRIARERVAAEEAKRQADERLKLEVETKRIAAEKAKAATQTTAQVTKTESQLWI